MVIDGRETSSIMVWVLTAGKAALMLAIAGYTAVAARSSRDMDNTAVFNRTRFIRLHLFPVDVNSRTHSSPPFAIFFGPLIEAGHRLRYNGDNRMWNTPLFSVRLSPAQQSQAVTLSDKCLLDTFQGRLRPLAGGLHVSLLWFGLLCYPPPFCRLVSLGTICSYYIGTFSSCQYFQERFL